MNRNSDSKKYDIYKPRVLSSDKIFDEDSDDKSKYYYIY